MSPNMPGDGDLTSQVPKLNTTAIDGETVKGIEVAGQEFKLSDVLNDKVPAFNKLSMQGKPEDHAFNNFVVREMPGSSATKATFALQPTDSRLRETLVLKTRELFGVEVDNISDMVSEFPYIIQVTDESVLSYALDIFKTLDAQLEEIKKGIV